ncbi:kinesin-like protein [Aspergillus campestris IBT 28561]|uniref:Kinesin-like protein n=1 Tax=Aspergillus campestris (strain IBT 28561) TaxID=1392248 RepID=A0A2I1DF74_ASPC2|nr:kinesin-like protein [Aspergillus campestris IBT 28561]PKY08529.1 kinesin-like protein [Aspergillus campestris IBT 28561]
MGTKTPPASLFQVYLRLRPPGPQHQDHQTERCMTIDTPETRDSQLDGQAPNAGPTHITLQPPSDTRKRAVEKFGFTKVFDESASQLNVFGETGIDSLVKGVLQEGRDGLIATLGVTGSGKSHTILGSKTQRGLTQMSLDVIFRSLESTIKPPDNSISPFLLASVSASDPSEAQIFSAQTFLEAVYTDPSERGRNSRAQTPMSSGRANTPMTDPTPAINFPRRNLPPRPGALPKSPDVSHLTLELNPNSEYIVLVSMYEVYNDRIFDLLSPAIVPGQGSTVSRQGANMQQKDRRKHLFFKSTEGSPDRKLVAGLRKIACSTYEEALAILEIGLTERRVTGTNSNSVSSRSHGFFCLEVKRRMRSKRTGEETWIGNTLTVADLAGSERARTAKTGGSTLAEAGKINESLMYLGQCLQMQSSIQDGNKTAVVPFRQCKLTELLFSNSFPSPGQAAGLNRHPQKALMIVTADPLGDYNATSQILRYSALAREVAVPRAPSIAESIGSNSLATASGRNSPDLTTAEELERATAEVKRLAEENEGLAMRLAEEEVMKAELELRLKASEETCIMIEQDVREECWAEMDERMEEERKKWQTALDEQAGHNNEHLDKKIELLSRGFHVHEDPASSEDDRVNDLEFENDQLRSKIAALERELNCRSPTKKPKPKNVLESSRNSNILGRESDIEVALQRMDQLKLADSMFSPAQPTKSPGKKPRKMATRKWDLAPEEDI